MKTGYGARYRCSHFTHEPTAGECTVFEMCQFLEPKRYATTFATAAKVGVLVTESARACSYAVIVQ